MTMARIRVFDDGEIEPSDCRKICSASYARVAPYAQGLMRHGKPPRIDKGSPNRSLAMLEATETGPTGLMR